MSEKTTIGITGGIGAGKSVISRVLRCNGFEVYDCDSEAKRLMEEDCEIKNAIQSKLGKDIYRSNGSLNRGELAQKLFSDSEVRTFVNSVVHKAVRDDISKRRDVVKGLFFIESAIIVTGGIAPMCNQIWIVTAPLDERINRVIKRDDTNLVSIRKRIESQEKELAFLKDDNIIIMENDNKSPLLPEILKLTKKFNNYQTYAISC